MLRLTTKVARSPASSARSSSAATRISSIDLRPGLGEQRGQLVLAQLLPLAPLGDRPRGQARRSSGLLAPPPRPPPRNEAPVLELDHVENPLLHPLGVHVLRVDAQPLGQRVAPAAPAPFAPDGGWETAPRARCGRRWPTAHPDRSPPPRPAPATSPTDSAEPESRHPASTAALGDQPLDLLDGSPALAQLAEAAGPVRPELWGARHPARSLASDGCRAEGPPSAPPRESSLIGDLGHLARRSSADAGRSSAGSPPGCGRSGRAARPALRATRPAPPRVSPIPTRIPLVNGIFSSPAASIVARRRAGCLVGEPAWTVSISRSEADSSISPWEAVTSRSRARSSRSRTPMFVWGRMPRSRARSQAQTT